MHYFLLLSATYHLRNDITLVSSYKLVFKLIIDTLARISHVVTFSFELDQKLYDLLTKKFH